MAKRIEFREADAPTTVLDEADVKAIEASTSSGHALPAPPPIEKPRTQTVTATLYTYAPVFDVKAPNWRFHYRNKPTYADIKGTTIARDAVSRGKSSMDDRYKVRMEIAPPAADALQGS